MFGRLSEVSPSSPAILPWLVHVRLTAVILCILLARGGAGILLAAPQHPNLFVNARELDLLRMKLPAEPWRVSCGNWRWMPSSTANLLQEWISDA